jgi:hypothetical protein
MDGSLGNFSDDDRELIFQDSDLVSENDISIDVAPGPMAEKIENDPEFDALMSNEEILELVRRRATK